MTADAGPRTEREHEVGILTGPLLTLDLKREIEAVRAYGEDTREIPIPVWC